MLKRILYVLLVLIIGYFILCFFSPKQNHFSVTKNIGATPDKVFEQIGDYKNWGNWSKWHKMDPNMTIIYGATTSGIGGKYSWQSEKLGEGNQEILESIPNQKFTSKIYFKNFDSYSSGTMTLKDKANGTTDVTWSYDDVADIPLYFRGFSKIMNFEKSISKDYNEGLQNLDDYLRNATGLNVGTLNKAEE